MPYCPNCGSEVGEKHNFCGSCATPLPNCPDELRESHYDSLSDGFLSGEEYQYLLDVFSGDRQPHQDDPERQEIINRARSSLLDFRLLSQLDTIEDRDVFGKPVASLVKHIDGGNVDAAAKGRAFGLLDLFPMLVKSLTPLLAAGLIESMISSGISVPEGGDLDVSVSIEIQPDEVTLADIQRRREEGTEIDYFESWVLYQEGDIEKPEL